MRVPHFIPRNHSNEMPSNCIWFDTETKPRPRAKGGHTHHLWFGWACHQRREKGGKWSNPKWLRFTTLSQFWDFVIQHTRAKTRLYLFAHNGAYDLPVMHAFSELPRRGFALENAVVDAPPMILVWKRERATIRFIDTLNLWRVPLEKLGESVGLPKLPMPSRSDSRAAWDTYGKRDTDVIRTACIRWFDFLIEHDLGGFAPTLASQAFNSFRHRFMPCGIFADVSEPALEMARAAYLGGRTECFRIGEYSGRFFYLDVNSMYPAVMRGARYPVKLLGVYGRPTAGEIEDWLANWCLVAECDLDTRAPIYPKVHENKLVFPTGRFRATLAGPEFGEAWRRGHIKAVHRVALYHGAELFTAFVEFFYQKRREAIDAGDPAAKFMHRIFMNSLYGKFGQRGRRFETVGEGAADVVAVWDELDLDAGTVTHFRQFGGVVQEWIEEGESTHSHPAIAAYVTSYARLVLWRAIEQAGRANCWYCDTDSLVVNERGYKRLRGVIDPAALGAWKLERELSHLVIHGPKDYVFDGERKVKGIRQAADWIAPNAAVQDHFVGFRGLLREGSLDAPIVYPITKTLSRKYTKGTVGPSGRVSPLSLTP